MSGEVRDEILNHYIFDYNPYTRYWNAFKREQYLDYFNGKLEEKEYIRGKSQDDIVRYLKVQK